ncbi:MAG: radical SAM family heme chaperone HemW [Chitinophagaceae bacterium]|nr:radical SAM family heme chaperone HemW [Chitinophagaceae bacterium]MCW5925981.1 radical SAM family heme chaperone HemW [Chitinophagaceae bacterium]
MAGIYIHIPFCKQACVYCNFHFSTSLKQKNDLISALLKEIELTSLFEENPPVETIYLGGGTPSILDENELTAIFNALFKKFHIKDAVEVTLEANPDDIHLPQLLTWKKAGINRLSIGIQSFYERDLQWMKRAHNAQQAGESLVLAHQAGFENISVDLIYGIPGLTDQEWQENVFKLVAMGVPHISSYALTVEPSTALHHLVNKKKQPDVDTEQQSRQFLQLIQWLTGNGYEHYEISNFSLPGKRSRHNSSYWQGKPYYGLGPSAHSFDGINIRYWNIANNSVYIRSLHKNMIPFEKEILTPTQRVNEYIMTALRTSEGINLQLVEEKFGTELKNKITWQAARFDATKLILQNDFLKLTDEGKLFADGIAADMFQD